MPVLRLKSIAILSFAILSSMGFTKMTHTIIVDGEDIIATVDDVSVAENRPNFLKFKLSGGHEFIRKIVELNDPLLEKEMQGDLKFWKSVQQKNGLTFFRHDGIEIKRTIDATCDIIHIWSELKNGDLVVSKGLAPTTALIKKDSKVYQQYLSVRRFFSKKPSYLDGKPMDVSDVKLVIAWDWKYGYFLYVGYHPEFCQEEN